MRRFLKRRWHGIPVGILAVLLLVGVAAAGAYTLAVSLSFTATVTEPVTVWRSWNDSGTWHPFVEGGTISDRSWVANNDYTMWIRVHNASDNPITVALVYEVTPPDGGDVAHVTLTGSVLVGGGLVCDPGYTERELFWNVSGSAVPGDYVVAVNFTRG